MSSDREVPAGNPRAVDLVGEDGQPVGHRETMDWLRAAYLPPDEVVRPGLTAGQWLRFLARPETPEGAVYRSAVDYGRAGRGGPALRLYAYGRADVAERRPGVVFIHGGGWANLHPFLHIRHANHLAARGYVTATISYRLLPEATLYDCLADAKCALRWMRANATELGLDPDRLAVAGGSAGGHLAAMAATTPGRFEGAGGHERSSSAVQAAVLWYPVTDLRVPGATHPGFAANCARLGGSDDGIRELSPLSHVSAATPPILTMTGDQDELTSVQMVREFHQRLDAAGVENRLEIFPDRPHAFDLFPGDWERCFDLMAEFLDAHLGPADQ